MFRSKVRIFFMFDIVLVSTDKAKKNHIKIEMILTSDTVKARFSYENALNVLCDPEKLYSILVEYSIYH